MCEVHYEQAVSPASVSRCISFWRRMEDPADLIDLLLSLVLCRPPASKQGPR
jgi:hypothetical protein